MLEPQSLLDAAQHLLGGSSRGAPNQTRLRRAISTAYYALFHALVRNATDAFVGAKYRSQPRYETIYRGFEYGLMREVCESIDKQTLGQKASKAMGSKTVSRQLRDVANAFIDLQKQRHWADYSPAGKTTRPQAQVLIDLANLAIRQLTAAPNEERRNFLAFLMAGSRG